MADQQRIAQYSNDVTLVETPVGTPPLGTPEPDNLEPWSTLIDLIENAELNSVIDLEGRGFAPTQIELSEGLITSRTKIDIGSDSNFTIKNGYFSGGIDMDWQEASDVGDGWWSAPLPALDKAEWRDPRVYLQDVRASENPLMVMYPKPPADLDDYRMTFHKFFWYPNERPANDPVDGGRAHYPGYCHTISDDGVIGNNVKNDKIIGFRVTSRELAQEIIEAIGTQVNDRLTMHVHAGPNVMDACVVAQTNNDLYGTGLVTQLDYDNSGIDPIIAQRIDELGEDGIEFPLEDATGYIDIMFEEPSLIYNYYIHVAATSSKRYAKSTPPEEGGLVYEEGYDIGEYFLDLANQRVVYKPAYEGRPVKARLPFLINLFSYSSNSFPTFEQCTMESQQGNGGGGTDAFIRGRGGDSASNLVTVRKCYFTGIGGHAIRECMIDIEDSEIYRSVSRGIASVPGARVHRCKMTHFEEKSALLVLGSTTTGSRPLRHSSVTNSYFELRGTAHGQGVSFYKGCWQNSTLKNNIILTSGTLYSFQPGSGTGVVNEDQSWYHGGLDSEDPLHPACRMENNLCYQWDIYQPIAGGQQAFSYNGQSDHYMAITEETQLRLTLGLNTKNAGILPFTYEFPSRDDETADRPVFYGQRGQTFTITNEAYLTEEMNNEMSDCTNGNCTPCEECTGEFDDCGQDETGQNQNVGRCRQLGFYRAYIAEDDSPSGGANKIDKKTDRHTVSETFYDEFGDEMDEFDPIDTHKQVLVIRIANDASDWLWLNGLQPDGSSKGSGQLITVKDADFKTPRVYMRNNTVWMNYERIKDTADAENSDFNATMRNWGVNLRKLRNCDVYVENNLAGHMSASELGEQYLHDGNKAFCAPTTRLNKHAKNMLFDANTNTQSFSVAENDLRVSNYAEEPPVVDLSTVSPAGRALNNATDGGNLGHRFIPTPTEQDLFDGKLGYDWSDTYVPQELPLHPNEDDFSEARLEKDLGLYFGETIGKLEVTYNGSICSDGNGTCTCQDNWDDTCPEYQNIECGGDSVEVSEGTLQSARNGNIGGQPIGCFFQNQGSASTYVRLFAADAFSRQDVEYPYPQCNWPSSQQEDLFAAVAWSDAFNKNGHAMSFNVIKAGTTEEIEIGVVVGRPGGVQCEDEDDLSPECGYYIGDIGQAQQWGDNDDDGIAETPPYSGYYKVKGVYNRTDNPELLQYETGDKLIVRHVIPIIGATTYTGLG